MTPTEMPQNREQEFEHLLSRLFDDGLNADEHHCLGELLQAGAEFRQRYLEACQMHAMLQHEQGLLTGLDEGSGSAVGPALSAGERVRRAGLCRALLAIAASLAIACGLWFWQGDGWGSSEVQQPERGPVVAQLVLTVGGRFAFGADGIMSPDAGTALPAGRYELQAGVVQIEFDSGAQVVVEGPARFVLESAKKMALYDGRLSAHVPPPAIGFTVETPGAEIVDHGTEFGVATQSGEHVEVHVFDGEVEVKPRSQQDFASTPVWLVTGEATRVDETTNVPAGIDMAAADFIRTIDELPNAYSRRILELDPSIYYRMEPTTDGITLYDSSKNISHGRIEVGNSPNGPWANGKVGAALRLGGSRMQRYGIVPAYPQTDGDQMSIVAWIFAESRPRWASIVKNWANPDRGQIHFGLKGDTGTLDAQIHQPDGKKVRAREEIPLPLNQWHHVAVVADGSFLRLYRNGVEIDSQKYEGLYRNLDAKSLAIGTKLNEMEDAPKRPDLGFWHGRLDEIAVFYHALSADEVRELYDLGNSN